MQYILRRLSVPLSELTRENEWSLLKHLSARKMGISEGEIQEFGILKESLDARKKSNLQVVYSVLVSCCGRVKSDKDIVAFLPSETIPLQKREPSTRPVIVGAGPCGLFCAYELIERGFSPIILERGEEVDKRFLSVQSFWSKGILNPESNVQFGEGGAGTFSDGKLTTRINDPRCTKVLEAFHTHGAPNEVLYMAKPHVGTDVLRQVIKSMREKLRERGAQFLFSTRMESLLIKNGTVQGVRLSDGTEILTSAVILAIGHSSRDTFQKLYEQGVEMTQKPFSVGVRIEHLQEWINEAQYGKMKHYKLGAADYQLFEHMEDRTAYSFCMCPGGVVVAAASEEKTVVTNGMSYHARNGVNANSAFVVSVTPKDFESTHPLSGIDFQRRLEQACYQKTGGYRAPVQKLSDFLSDKPSMALGQVKPSYTGDTVCTSISNILPDFVVNGIKRAAPLFDRKLKGFMHPDALLTAVETRTSSPVRIQRNELFQSTSIKGLFPAGEGAGYAGGIVSAAVDGIRVAEQVSMDF